MDNEKLLISRISDNKRLSEKYQSPKFSDFLDENESAVIKAELSLSGGMFFGGYEGAKRTMIGYFPDWYDGGYDDFPISVIEIIKKSGKELTHRDYLGTVMSLGLERRKIGDIVVTDRGAYVFVCSDIKELV
ncbi:MAG: YlmH/Sll1252 family protein, partial [Clostridia bacterium]|nr:YlmH/Sll1252 family protein [Clostridia bacterium]